MKINKTFWFWLVLIIAILITVLYICGWWAGSHPVIDSPELVG